MSKDEPLRGGEELLYQRVLEDVHRSLVGDLYVGTGSYLEQDGFAMYTGNHFTLDRLRSRYGDATETDPVADVKQALLCCQDVEDSSWPQDTEAYTGDTDVYLDATDGGDIDAFRSLAETDYGQWLDMTVDALQEQGYDAAEQMLVDLANEANHCEPYQVAEDGILQSVRDVF
jgi:hypothetical protein